LHFRLFGHLEYVIDLDAEVSKGALKLRMAKEQLYRAQILRAAMAQRCFRAGPKALRAL
jgi:regulator of protease activity HflC (stomatin/prohibitin superfamily)